MQSYGNEIKQKMLRSLQIQSDHPLITLENQVFSDFSGSIEMNIGVKWLQKSIKNYDDR